MEPTLDLYGATVCLIPLDFGNQLLPFQSKLLTLMTHKEGNNQIAQYIHNGWVIKEEMYLMIHDNHNTFLSILIRDGQYGLHFIHFTFCNSNHSIAYWSSKDKAWIGRL